MSINSTQTVKCPNCAQLQQITTWDAITADDSPDLKKDLLSGKINMFECDICGTKALMPNPILYTHHAQKLIISFYPCQDKSQKSKRYEDIKKLSRKSGELESLEHYHLRFVSDYNEFMEKILIFDHGFHDKVIELLKLMILAQESEHAAHRTAMFGKFEHNCLEFMIQDKKEGQLYTSSVPLDTYNTVKTQLMQTGVKPYSFDWEIVDIEYASALLRGLNNHL